MALQLQLSRRYYRDVVRPAIARAMPAALEVAVFADFFGDSGSFGWDDGLSQDTDWGARAMIIVPDDRRDLVEPLRDLVARLPSGLDGHLAAGWSSPRVPVQTMAEHFVYGDPPLDSLAWLQTDEQRLLAMVTGAILHDPQGTFVSRLARWRRSYYPDDVWLHRLAGAVRTTAATIAGADKLFARQDAYGLAYANGLAVHDVLQIVFLLERQWAPFFKWRSRAYRLLPATPAGLDKWLEQASAAPNGLQRIAALWKLNDLLRQTLHERGLVPTPDESLATMADQLDARVSDPAVRAAAPWNTIAHQRWYEWRTG